MSEILGLLDSLEAAILDGKKIPMTDQMVINEKEAIHIIDKIRLVINNGGDIIRKAVDITPAEDVVEADSSRVESVELATPETKQQAHKLVENAKKDANQIKEGANHYADNVLANLQLMVTKLQKNILTIEKNIENGRDVLDKERHDKEEDTIYEG